MNYIDTEKTIISLLREKHISYNEVYAHKHYCLPVHQLEIGIWWGDWKHDHLAVQWIVEPWLEENGYHLISHQEEVTEENGSDCYSAKHIFNFV